jgi:hypothetical protein
VIITLIAIILGRLSSSDRSPIQSLLFAFGTEAGCLHHASPGELFIKFIDPNTSPAVKNQNSSFSCERGTMIPNSTSISGTGEKSGERSLIRVWRSGRTGLAGDAEGLHYMTFRREVNVHDYRR